MTSQQSGRVALVGAGPGDADLWTVRAVRLLEAADLVLYDSLVDAEALRRATQASCFCVGKRAGRASMSQETIHRLMIRAARQGKFVVRLKGGDPFVFGRGAEEVMALAAAGISVEVVPGVSAALSAPALAGIPVTHRGVSSGFLVVSGHGADVFDETLGAVSANSVSLVVLMGLGHRQQLAADLVARGWRAATPAAIVCAASTPRAWTWSGSIATMGGAEVPAGLAGVVVVGDVVRLRDALSGATESVASTDEEVRHGGTR